MHALIIAIDAPSLVYLFIFFRLPTVEIAFAIGLRKLLYNLMPATTAREYFVGAVRMSAASVDPPVCPPPYRPGAEPRRRQRTGFSRANCRSDWTDLLKIEFTLSWSSSFDVMQWAVVTFREQFFCPSGILRLSDGAVESVVLGHGTLLYSERFSFIQWLFAYSSIIHSDRFSLSISD